MTATRNIWALPMLLMLVKSTAAFQPLAQFAQSAVLIDKYVWVFGGEGSVASLSNLHSLDISTSWSTVSPAWTDHSFDGNTFTVPQTFFHAMWVSGDGQSFYTWGGGNDDN